ncbi:MAG: murein biosynthesis integral membrane protein MurJ [Pseudomonadota bacterium]
MDTDQKASTRSLLQATTTVGAMTGVSRVLGLVRDMVFTRLFGASWMMDAFIIANRIPNMLRRFFAEGAFAQAFVPVLNEVRSEGGDVAVRILTARVAGTLGLALFVLTLVGVIAAPLIVAGFSPGFLADADTYALATQMLRITFPYLLFISLTSLAASVLNTYGQFAVPALTPVLLNIVLIACAIWLAPMFDYPTMALAVGVFIGGLVQLGCQLPFVRRLGVLAWPRWSWHDAQVQKIFRLMLPAIFGSSVAQINLIINNVIASLLGEGRITWLYYSDRLMEFPLGVFGIALATVILPSLSRNVAGDDTAQFSATIDWALRLVMLIALPATLGLAVLAGPLITTLFFGGVFNAHDVQMAQASLWAFSGGLTAFITVKVLAPGYFARQDTKTPVKIGVLALAVNLILSLVFVGALIQFDVEATHAGLAMALTCAAAINALLLYTGLRRRKLVSPHAGWWAFSIRILTANAMLIIMLLWFSPQLSWWLQADVADRVLRLSALVIGGVVIYTVTALVAGIRPAHLKLQVSR